jgi:hemin transport system ATP-binding protein
VFQAVNLVPFLTARENLLLMASLAGQRRRAARARADGLLAALDLAGQADRLPGLLSGGERQRAAVARALMNEPAVLLADEPTSSLDTGTGQAVAALIAREVHQRGMAGLLVTHDPRLTSHTDRVVRLTDGGLIAADDIGPAEKEVP